MGNIDEKADARSEEEKCDDDFNARRSGNAGCQSKVYGNQQERVNRENRPESNFFASGAADAGGMLSQMIGECRDQLATKKEEAKRFKDELKRVGNEIKRLESRILEFEALQQDLEKGIEENS